MRRILTAVLSGLLLAVLARSAGAQAFSVGLRLDLPIANGGVDVAIGDLNRDGNPDLVTANASANSVSVLLGDGKGGFGPKSDVPVGASLSSLALADLDGDGNPDLAVVTGGAVRVLLGNGAGGFGVATVLTTSLPSGEVRIADMSGDGRLDVIVVSVGAFQARIFPGNGAGGFGPRQDVDVPFNTSTCAIGDLNGDGRLDWCALTPNLFLTVFLATSSGSYQRFDYGGAGMTRVALGDVNGDGQPELVTVNGSTGVVSVYLINGAGLLGAQIDSPATANVNRVSIGDMNGDGRADLALTTSTGSSLGVMLGNGTGAFAAPAALTPIPSGASGLAVGDLNGDGRPDAVTVSNNAFATVLLNATGGEFRARTDWSVGANPRGVAMGDVNHDGRPDVAVANAGINTVSMLVANAAGGFQKQDFATQTAPVGVAIGDVNADGNADLMVTNSQSASVSRWLGTGLGDFFTRLDDPVGAGPVAVALADLKAGGTLDAVVVNNIGSTVSVFPNIAGSLLPRTDYVTGANPASLAIGDLNADGRPDFVVSNGSSSTVSVFLGTGQALFGAKTDFATGVTPLGIALGDVNGDGKPDLAVANLSSGTVSVLLGNGTGGFLPKVDFAVPAPPYAVAIGDVNGDGRPDLSVAYLAVATVSVLLGNGAGSFSPAPDVTTAGGSEALTIGDLNGDGRLDLAVAAKASGGTGKLSVMLGRVPTKTALSISAGPIVVGGLMMLTATVSVPAPGTGTPADSVRFFDGTTLLGTAPLVGGTAWLAIFAPYLGARATTAVYKGDGKFFGSISNVATPRVVMTAVPAITSIVDVTGDQGGQARLRFARSAFDYLGSGTPITGYQVYRRSIVAGALTAAASDPTSVQLAGWDQLTTLPATTDDIYQVVVPTLADSNGAGLHRAVLFVRALTATPGTHYDSPPDSGYSVDNLSPAAPSALTAVYAAGATHLHWVRNGEQDLASYRVYRGTSAGFIPGAGTFLATVPDTGFADAGPPGSFYKVGAIDVNGNQSAFALVGPDATIDVPPAGAPAFALERVRPNPAPAMRLVVSFTLPTEAPAQLEVFDVRGARVAAQDVGSLGAGRHTVPLPSPRLAPGIYLVRLSQGVAAMTQRITVVPR